MEENECHREENKTSEECLSLVCAVCKRESTLSQIDENGGFCPKCGERLRMPQVT
jgi:rRNA maturation endonuclease Nob1